MRSTTGVLSLLLFVVMAMVFATGALAQGEGPPTSSEASELVSKHGLVAGLSILGGLALIGIVWFVVKKRNPLGEPELPPTRNLGATAFFVCLLAALPLTGCAGGVQKAALREAIGGLKPVFTDLEGRAQPPLTDTERSANARHWQALENAAK